MRMVPTTTATLGTQVNQHADHALNLPLSGSYIALRRQQLQQPRVAPLEP
jgi:hypothetical protein